MRMLSGQLLPGHFGIENGSAPGGRTKSIQRFGSQGAIFVPDIIMMAEKKNLRSVERMLRRFNEQGLTRGLSRSWSSNWSTTKTRYDCWPSSSALAGPSAKRSDSGFRSDA